jgi:outer membrane autotransporter protein
VVAPRDATIFANAAFGFAEANQASATSLLDRMAPGGDGDAFALGSGGKGWIEAIGSDLDPSSAGTDIPSFRVLSGGVEGGADIDLGASSRLGGSLGYEQGRLTDSDGGVANENLFRVGVYGEVQAGRLVLSADAGYAHAGQTFARASGFGASLSSRDVDEGFGAAQVSAPLATGGTRITPQAGVVIASLSAGAFQESNGQSAAFAVSGLAANGTFVSPFAKVSISHDFTQGGGLVVTPAGEVGYRYDGLASQLSETLVAVDGTSFVGNTSHLSRNAAVLGASLTAHQGRWAGFLRYQGDFAGNWNDQRLQGGLRVRF